MKPFPDLKFETVIPGEHVGVIAKYLTAAIADVDRLPIAVARILVHSMGQSMFAALNALDRNSSGTWINK